MRWPQIFFLLPFLLAAAPPESELRALMDAKQQAWNRGDIPAFMAAYEKAPEITFLGASGITRGHQAVLERYQKNYSTREKMGKLTFQIDEIRALSAETALLLGRFALERSEAAGGPSSGRFTLVWKKTEAGWRIVHDHTSP